MKYIFKLADKALLDKIYNLYEKRIEWMDEVGIKQWNTTNYNEAYPKSYYRNQIESNNLYVLLNDSFEVLGAIILTEDDYRWNDCSKYKAYYLHNFVTDNKVKGIGKVILKSVEELAKENNKQKLRLDCAEDNEFLNNYYENSGYILVGKCIDGVYKGNKREKTLK